MAPATACCESPRVTVASPWRTLMRATPGSPANAGRGARPIAATMKGSAKKAPVRKTRFMVSSSPYPSDAGSPYVPLNEIFPRLVPPPRRLSPKSNPALIWR